MSGGDKGMSVADLSVKELQQYSQVLEEETRALTSHFSALRGGRDRYHGSKVVLENIEDCEEGEEMLVPLTKSLYVPGVLKNPKTAIIEVCAFCAYFSLFAARFFLQEF